MEKEDETELIKKRGYEREKRYRKFLEKKHMKHSEIDGGEK